jgi:hypothetical protein
MPRQELAQEKTLDDEREQIVDVVVGPSSRPRPLNIYGTVIDFCAVFPANVPKTVTEPDLSPWKQCVCGWLVWRTTDTTALSDTAGVQRSAAVRPFES